MKCNFLSKKQENALKAFADANDALFKMGITTTDSFTGEIGEYVACQVFNLKKMPRGTEDVDAESVTGERYQVKAKVISECKYGYSIKNLTSSKFDFLVIVYFNKLYNVVKILKIPSSIISKKSFSVTKNIVENYSIKKSSIILPQEKKDAILDFGKSYEKLEKLEIIRSRKIVGEIGELYACNLLGLYQNLGCNEKGIDATDDNGTTYEIKTRRVYESERRNNHKSTRRLNNLDGKSADYLIVVTLDREFKCSGMWIMPMSSVENPKSANLKIVNTAKDVRSLVKSQNDWLNNR